MAHIPSCIDVTTLYDTYYVRYMSWSKRYFSQYDTAQREDIFHDALIIYWENCQKGRFQQMNAPLINLLIGIAHNLFKRQGSKNQISFPEQMPEPVREAVHTILDKIIQEEDTQKQNTWLKNGFQELGEECQRLLTLFYYEKKKIPEITTLMAYKNENVASAIKSRCLRTLKEILENHGTHK